MPRRSYHQYCGLARALDVVGERWTLLIVRNLLLGPQRYSELLRTLPGITTNLLAKRLQEMEAERLIERAPDGTAGGTYRLTDLGRSLEPAVHALGTWGWHRLGRPGARDTRNIDWLFVAMRRRYNGNARLTVDLDVDGGQYHMVLRGKTAEIGRGRPPAPDLRVRGTGLDIARLFLEGLDSALSTDIEIDGTAEDIRTLVESFSRGDPLPPDALPNAASPRRRLPGRRRE
jgi:DNA-binding HxlR family transcriptional regulator